MHNTMTWQGETSQILNGVFKTLYMKTDVDDSFKNYTKLTTSEFDPNFVNSAQGIVGTGMASIISPGQIPASQAPLIGFTKTYSQVQFRHDTAFDYKSQLAIKNMGDKKSAVKLAEEITLPKLANSKEMIEATKDYLFQSMIANGYSTSFVFTPIQTGVYGTPTTVDTTTADGVAFWSRNHLLENGGPNWSNIIDDGATLSAKLSESSLVAARYLNSLKKQGNGLPYMSNLDTLVVVKDSPAFFTATTLKKTIERGYYPSQQPGVAGSFNDAPRTSGFEIIALPPYNNGTVGTGMNGDFWMMIDLTKAKKGEGFRHVYAMEIEPVQLPTQMNYDIIISNTTFATFYAIDLRCAMASDGSETN